MALLKNMNELLTKLVESQDKTDKILTHQENVSVYLKDLNEFLRGDREARKEEFQTSESPISS